MDNSKEEKKTIKTNQLSETREEKISISYFKLFLVIFMLFSSINICLAENDINYLATKQLEYLKKIRTTDYKDKNNVKKLYDEWNKLYSDNRKLIEEEIRLKKAEPNESLKKELDLVNKSFSIRENRYLSSIQFQLWNNFDTNNYKPENFDKLFERISKINNCFFLDEEAKVDNWIVKINECHIIGYKEKKKLSLKDNFPNNYLSLNIKLTNNDKKAAYLPEMVLVCDSSDESLKGSEFSRYMGYYKGKIDSIYKLNPFLSREGLVIFELPERIIYYTNCKLKVGNKNITYIDLGK